MSFCGTDLSNARTHYVNGFMINPNTQQVLFIEKQRPEKQRGKWNGVGGHIEPGETPLQAMVREFREETSVETTEGMWQHTLSMWTNRSLVHFYRSLVVDGFPQFRQTTDEALGLFFLTSIYEGLPVLDNMRWILPLQFAQHVAFPLTVHYTA